MASVAPPTRPRSRSRSEHRPSTAPAVSLVQPRPPHSLYRPSNININIEAVLQSTPRKRGSGGLALQARDSVAVRKRTMSTGAMSARVARYNARKANADLLQPTAKNPGRSPSGSSRHRNRSHSPARAPANTQISRSPSPSSSSPSQSPTPVTPGQPPLSGGPSSFQERGRTHVPHDSQGTTTSAYPPSSSISSRSSSPSPERSRTPSRPSLPPKPPSINIAPITTSLDLDPDDVNARLRLLVNNSYFLPPAHAKPELSPSRPSTGDMKGATSPSAFKEFFRVGKKKDRKASESSGYTSEGARNTPLGRLLRVPSDESPLLNGSDGRFGGPRHGDGYFDVPSSDERSRNRVVVVRETLEELPPPLPRAPFRAHAYSAMDAAYNDPTTHYDVPPPTHYPSFVDLRLDAAGITGNVQVDQFVPPGDSWSPAPSSPIGSGMDPQERVWRRAILEQAVDLSLSSTGSEAGIPDGASFTRGGRLGSEESAGVGFNSFGVITPTSPKSPKNKRSWWGRKDKDPEDVPRRSSTSSSSNTRDAPRNSGSQRGTHSVDLDAQSQTSLQRVRRDLAIGQRIIPNVQAELEEYERELALRAREREKETGLPPPLRLKPVALAGIMTSSAPATPLSSYGQDPPDSGTSTILRPPPAHRRGEKRRTASDDDVAREFMPGHSTIRKSLSSPLLSDLHETGVDVEGHVTSHSEGNESINGVAAPSFVLQDPSGVTSLVNSVTVDSFSSGSHYDDDDGGHDFDGGVMTPAEHYHEDDSASLEQWYAAQSSSLNGSGRPSMDSFGAERVRSPEYHPRASSTFGYRRSNTSVATPSPLRDPPRGIEVDISGDPMEHLSVMQRSSPTPSGESHISSARGYVSALDYTVTAPGTPSAGGPASPSIISFRSAGTRIAPTPTPSVPEQNESGVESEAPIEFFDSIQHESFMEGDDGSTDSDDGMTPPEPDMTFATYSPRPSEPQPLSRKSLNSARPTPAFATQFRNASQPQLPVTRAEALPPLDMSFRPITPYDMLDRKKPLTNTPLSTPAAASGGILSQFKGRPSKSPVTTTGPFLGIGKKRSGTSAVVLPESTFELLRYPNGTAFSVGSGAGTTTTGSELDSVEGSSRGFDGAMSQGSLLSAQSSDTASLRQAGSWQGTQEESVRKLDGMMMQHLEAERDRLRKIASAAKERGGRARDRH